MIYQTSLIFVMIVSVISFGDENKTIPYSRELLQEKFPGFGTDYIIMSGDNGEEIYGYLKMNPYVRISLFAPSNVSNDLTYTLYNRDLPNGWIITNLTDLSNRYDPNKKTKFITHGWLSSGTSGICIEIKNAFLNKSDVNVIVMDWNPIAKNVFYNIPMEATFPVGNEYGKFANYLISKLNANPKDFHMIGHSLGAHVTGFAGRTIKGKPGRITGLDPALPGFEPSFVPGGRLQSSDADFVDIIHTCAGFLGIKTPIGHADFYPNGGGPPQPGCDSILRIAEACSHRRSWQLFAYSVLLDEPFVATKCQYNVYSITNCTGRAVAMGEPAPSHARGTYYVQTTAGDPFVKVVPLPINFQETNYLD